MSSTIYKVDKIVGHKTQKGAAYYKVHWVGYTSRHDSWEPAKNLSTCTVLIQAFHNEQAGRTEAQGKKKRQSRKFPSRRVEFSSEEEEIETTTVTVRQSQRSHTPTGFLVTEKDQTTTTTLRRSPRSHKPVHYFSSELPDHRQHAPTPSTELSSEEEDVQVATTVRKHQHAHQCTSSLPTKQGHQRAIRRGTRSRTPVERPSSGVSRNRRLNSAPPSQKVATVKPQKKAVPAGTLDKKPADVTSSISTVETRIRHRLSEMTEKMRKSITESIRSDLLRRSEPPVQPVPIQSSPPMTRSRAAKLVQSRPLLKPSSTYTRPKLRSRSPQSKVVQEKETKVEKGKKSIKSDGEKKAVQGKEKKSGSVTVGGRRTASSNFPVQDVSAQTEHPYVEEKEEYPSWMQLGYEEVVFALIVLALILFAFYCYNSEAC